MIGRVTAPVFTFTVNANMLYFYLIWNIWFIDEGYNVYRGLFIMNFTKYENGCVFYYLDKKILI